MSVETPEPIVRDAAEDPLDEAVVAAVAAAEGIPPIELDARLFDVIDGDALNRLFKQSTDGATVSFTFDGWAVTVASDGRITVMAN